ncbi:hypothetical protein EMIHUDRAFT_216661 [Emiliania huxleyi CCMP1516]|uniref:SET domain-containing protein n=2 Tax=Emiliania huxleyi TaxID=2903 RepID=A0A0D3IDD8_EMIH1|nr:hypothetical protein EMIHUDRAFT_216661 [Emiliania huxleyi CCMP1516]EOD09273.1 hypothetical protein EMIHUDRAFT_216661 [Emiliania huxleyi CCMP1516]|eukprot:XP_005761702.1 hypothetical protein EMIHUDRAFT_216661 [Emiliania huxleyi CCMP1516]
MGEWGNGCAVMDDFDGMKIRLPPSSECPRGTPVQPAGKTVKLQPQAELSMHVAGSESKTFGAQNLRGLALELDDIPAGIDITSELAKLPGVSVVDFLLEKAASAKVKTATMYGKPASEEGALEKARAGLRNAAACSAEYRAAEAAYGERAMNAEHPAARASWPDVRVRSLDDVEDTAPRLHQQAPGLPADADDATRASLDSLRRAVCEAYAADSRRAQRRGFGFSLRRAASSAGPGSGSVEAGVLYYPYDLMRLQGGAARFEGNACLMLRYDGTLVDGSETSLRLRVLPLLPYVRATEVGWRLRLDRGDAPPTEVRALPRTVAGSAAAPQIAARRRPIDALTEMIQHSLSEMAAAEDAPLRGLVLVASRDIEDEELFLDYRLNPATRDKWPGWYVPLDEEEAARRWG